MDAIAETRAKSNANLITFPKGKSGNPRGRKQGQRDYATIYREALIKIGNTKGMTADEVEEAIEEVGLNKALKGDFKFFEDIRSRIHGKPKQSVGIEGSGENGEIEINIRMV